jgi:hypothetical protein
MIRKSLSLLSSYPTHLYRVQYLDRDLKKHREGDLPALIEWSYQLKLINVIFYFKNTKHRDNGPSRLSWFLQGELQSEVFRRHDRYYRKGSLPALVCWDKDGNVETSSFCFYHDNED